MKTETEIKVRGMRILQETLGDVDAERFVAAMAREPFDYTEWHRGLWAGRSVKEIHQAALVARKPLQKNRQARIH
ncbi:MAG: hypothetical protein V1913_10155 [Fibrobacterota bacterium]